jgi:hypothetical protein
MHLSTNVKGVRLSREGSRDTIREEDQRGAAATFMKSNGRTNELRLVLLR